MTKMGILRKKNIKKALQNPFGFLVIFLLVILALANSFAISCLFSALLGTIISIITLTKISPDFLIKFVCKDSSWKLKLINSLSNIIGKNTIFIIVIGVILWILLNHTKKGKEILNLLD